MTFRQLRRRYYAIEPTLRRRLLKSFRAFVDPVTAARLWRCRRGTARIAFAWWQRWGCSPQTSEGFGP